MADGEGDQIVERSVRRQVGRRVLACRVGLLDRAGQVSVAAGVKFGVVSRPAIEGRAIQRPGAAGQNRGGEKQQRGSTGAAVSQVSASGWLHAVAPGGGAVVVMRSAAPSMVRTHGAGVQVPCLTQKDSPRGEV
jgi:hypothetical protein